MIWKLQQILRKILRKANILYTNDIHYINGADTLPPPLAPDEEQRILQNYDGTQLAVRQILIEHNLRLVAHIAKKYSHSSIDSDDLVSIGSIGLIKAVRSYKPESGRLATYASRCIENATLSLKHL